MQSIFANHSSFNRKQSLPERDFKLKWQTPLPVYLHILTLWLFQELLKYTAACNFQSQFAFIDRLASLTNYETRDIGSQVAVRIHSSRHVQAKFKVKIHPVQHAA